MKKLIAIIIILIFLCNSACARLPQKGDRVYISAGDTKYPLWSANAVTITDIENGFLCVQETFPGSDGKTYTENYCMGIGSIEWLRWEDEMYE